jgi:Aerotolerance regulator N-terminal/von Willebrand factor type A domain
MTLGFLTPQFLWLLLAIPLVILLHFVRARKKRHDVAALFLWKQAKEQAETRKRLSPSWLLALQIAFVTLASFALSQPSLLLRSRPDRVLIVDATASMTAKDSDGVRLEKALKLAQEVLQESGRVAIVRSGLEATVVQALSDNHSQATQALQGIKATDEQTDLQRAVEVAQSIAPKAELHLFTDTEFEYPQVKVHGVGGDALNMGISSFEVGIQQIFVAVSSNHPRPQEINLSIFQGQTSVAQTTMLVPANKQGYTTFPLDATSGFFRAEIEVPEWDALSLDNLAFTGQRELRVVSNSDDEILQRAFEALPNVRYQVLSNAALTEPDFDVRVIVGKLPENPRGNYLLFAPPSQEPVYKTIQTWDRSNPLLRFVDLSRASVGFPATLPFSDPTWKVLAETSDLTPVLIESQTPDVHIVAMNAYPGQTDLIRRTAFPLLMANIMEGFRASDQLPLGSPLVEGVMFEGKNKVGINKTVIDQPGLYQIGNQIVSSSLLNAEETRLPSFSAVPVADTPQRGSASVARVRNVALSLLALALIFLLLEWLLWSRTRDGWRFGFGRLGFSIGTPRR